MDERIKEALHQTYAAGFPGPEAALEMLPAGSWPEKP